MLTSLADKQNDPKIQEWAQSTLLKCKLTDAKAVYQLAKNQFASIAGGDVAALAAAVRRVTFAVTLHAFNLSQLKNIPNTLAFVQFNDNFDKTVDSAISWADTPRKA